jgi:hypothetical protein
LKSTSLVGTNRYDLNRLKAANAFVVEAWLGAENPSATISKEHPPVSASGAGGVHPARRFYVSERRALGFRLRYGVPTHHRRVNESTRLGRMPDAVYEPTACIRATLEAANRTGFDRSRLMFEFTENEPMRDPGHIGRIIAAYRDFGFMTFGAGNPPEVG